MWSNIILNNHGGLDEDSVKCPPTRYKHCGVLVPTEGPSNFDLYIYGGRSGTFPLKDFWRLDLKSGHWEELKSQPNSSDSDHWPPHLQEHSMVTYNSSIYVFGGEISLCYGEDLPPLWIFDYNTTTWRRWGPINIQDKEKNSRKTIKSPDMSRQMKTPVGRRGHTAVVWNSYMLVYGGYRDLKGSLGDLWAFHFETESWHLFSSHELHKKSNRPWYLLGGGGLLSNPFPAPRHSHVSVLYDNQLFVHGGMQDLTELQDLWKFDLKKRRWSSVKTKFGPGPLHGHVAVVALDSMLIMSGERGGKAVDEFWRFDFLSESWEKILVNGCRPCPRMWAWGAILPMIYKRVDPATGSPNLSNSGETDENKYWWDYDESLLPHEEGDHDEDIKEKPEEKKKSSLFPDLTRFTYNNGDYQALSESNSVCLSEEETSPRAPISNSKQPLGCGAETSGACHKSTSLQVIQEQEPPTPLIDLGDDNEENADNSTSTTATNTTTGNGTSPDDDSPSKDENVQMEFDPIPGPASSMSTTRARRSESANCLQFNGRKTNGVKKSASVRFADVNPPPSTSSSTCLVRECTSDYSSMDNIMSSNTKQGFENPNYHGSGSSSLFHQQAPKVPEAIELDCLDEKNDSRGGILRPRGILSPSTEENPLFYQVTTPHYMLLIGGSETHSSQVVSKRQPLSIWRLRVTHDLFTGSSGSDSYPGVAATQRQPLSTAPSNISTSRYHSVRQHHTTGF